jgi:excisionase family DNA binding protein
MDNQSVSQQRLTFSVTEAANAMGVSTATIYRLLSSGELKFVRIGDRRMIPAPELHRLTTAGTA